MRARNLLAFALLVGSTAIVDGTVLANGRADGGTTTICHAGDDGRVVPISVSARAVAAHVAHGDPVIGTEVDEDCEPLPALPPHVQPAGCYAVLTVTSTMVFYATTAYALVTPLAGARMHRDPFCADASTTTWPTSALTWAPTGADAVRQCTAAAVPNRTAVATATPHLFWCLQ